MRALKAADAGIFEDEIVPVEFEEVTYGEDGQVQRKQHVFKEDQHMRRDTTVEGLSKLRPVFMDGGTVTAGNASPLSDGAAGVLVMERETAERLGIEPKLRFVSFGVAGVPPEIMGIGLSRPYLKLSNGPD